MSKRFTETTKWEKPWFQNAAPKIKLLWYYLMDKCDNSGVWEINLQLASFQIGETVTVEDLKSFKDRLEILEWDDAANEGKLWIKRFCTYQYKVLSEKCPPHKNAMELLAKHGLMDRPEVLTSNPNATLDKGSTNPKPRAQDKDKDKEEDKDKEKSIVIAKRIIDYLNEKAGREFHYSSPTIGQIKARLSEKGVTEKGIKEMIDSKVREWLGTDYAQYLRPATLFAESKFSNYYGARKKSKVKATGSVDATGRKVKKFQ